MIIIKEPCSMVARYKSIYQNNWVSLDSKTKQNKNLQIVTLENTSWWEFRFLPWCNNWYRISPLAENWRKCIRQLCTDNGQQTEQDCNSWNISVEQYHQHSFDLDAFLNRGGGGRTQAEQDSLTQLKKKQEMGGSESWSG